MSRSVDEWRGETDDTPVPPRVKARVFVAKGGRCHRCTRKIPTGQQWTCEHFKALINGGENRERNLDVTCDWCLPIKNAEDVAEKSKVADTRNKHLGIKSKRKTIPGKRFNGDPIPSVWK